MHEGETGRRPFPTTHWSPIVRAEADDPVEREQALAEICASYWTPVYAYVRSLGHTPHDSEDYTQAIFGDLVKRSDFARADATRGKLRNYLLAAAKNHLASVHRRGGRQKRGGGVRDLSLDARDLEGRCLIPEPVDDVSPEKVLYRQWAMTLLEQVTASLAARYEKKGQARLYAALRPFITVSETQIPQNELASQLGMAEQALRVAIHRLRQRYRESLYESVRATLGRGQCIEEEIQHLLASFS